MTGTPQTWIRGPVMDWTPITANSPWYRHAANSARHLRGDDAKPRANKGTLTTQHWMTAMPTKRRGTERMGTTATNPGGECVNTTNTKRDRQ